MLHCSWDLCIGDKILFCTELIKCVSTELPRGTDCSVLQRQTVRLSRTSLYTATRIHLGKWRKKHPRVFNVGTRWRRVVSFIPQSFYCWGCVGLRFRLGTVGDRNILGFCEIPKPRSSVFAARSLVPTPIELSRCFFNCQNQWKFVEKLTLRLNLLQCYSRLIGKNEKGAPSLPDTFYLNVE